MRLLSVLITLVIFASFALPAFALEAEQPEWVVGKMSKKLVRGVTNIATAVVEVPKQTYLTIQDDGASGVVTGPLKGIGMTVYRAFMGVAETAFFLVPQPGYYDPMADPPYVWQGWEPKRTLSSERDVTRTEQEKKE